MIVKGMGVQIIITDSSGEQTKLDVNDLNYTMKPDAIQNREFVGGAPFELQVEAVIPAEQMSTLAKALREAEERMVVALRQYDYLVSLMTAAYAMKFAGFPADIRTDRDADGSTRATIKHDPKNVSPIPMNILSSVHAYSFTYKNMFPEIPPEKAMVVFLPPQFERPGCVALVQQPCPKDAN